MRGLNALCGFGARARGVTPIDNSRTRYLVDRGGGRLYWSADLLEWRESLFVPADLNSASNQSTVALWDIQRHPTIENRMIMCAGSSINAPSGLHYTDDYGVSFQPIPNLYTTGITPSVRFNAHLLFLEPGFWIAAHLFKESGRISWSYDDGATWAPHVRPIQRTVRSIFKFLGVYRVSNTISSTSESSNGTSWVRVDSRGVSGSIPPAVGAGFVFYVSTANNTISTSDLASPPTLRASVPGSPLSIAFGNGVFIVTMNTGSNFFRYMRSVDGITWTTIELPTTPGATEQFGHIVVFDGDKFVVLCRNNNPWLFRLSTDGLTWTTVRPPNFGFAAANIRAF